MCLEQRQELEEHILHLCFISVLEAAHHRWFRRILHVPWHDETQNKAIREWMAEEDVENMIRKRRLILWIK